MKRYTFRQLVEVDKLQELMDRFYATTGIPVGIIDFNGEVLVATGWQDICKLFHRTHPETLERCRQSDAYILDNLQVGEHIEYKCKNGLWDLAVPLVVEGEHLATLFLGQFFYTDEVPDNESFRRQASKFGFDEEKYLAALARVPVFTRDKVKDIMEYYTTFVRFIMDTGLTNLKRIVAEKALQESEERYRVLFEQCPDGIGLFDMETMKFVEFNTIAHSRLGYTREEFAELTAFEAAEGISPEMMAENYRILEDQGSVVFEFRDRTKEGEIRDVLVSVRMLQLGGKPMGHTVVKDITELKKMREEMVKAQKLESLGILAGGIAHDFNNILTAIQGNLSIVQMQLPPDDTSRERIDKCEKAVLHATGLTRQLLTFSRGGDPVKKIIDSRKTITDSVSFALHGSNVVSRLEIGDDIWPIEADEGQISQVLNNLLINADQAMPHGGTISIEAANHQIAHDEIPSLASGYFVRISIADQGSGISPEHLDRIFDPYFTTKESGTGLGLTSLYSIIRKHGGQVQVISSTGKGARFDVYLPACPEQSAIEEVASEPSVPAVGQGYVLVMDDEQTIRDVAEQMLVLMGYKAATCSNGKELIELYIDGLARGHKPDAAIMDLTIPGGMGGLEAASRILEIDPSALLIVSSGYSNDTVMASYQTYGFADTLAKPFRVEDLNNTLNRLLEKRDYCGEVETNTE